MEVQQVRFCPGGRHVDGGFFWFNRQQQRRYVIYMQYIITGIVT